MLMKLKLAVTMTTILATSGAFACAHFQIRTTDGNIINARSMEFGVDTETWASLPADFVIHTRGSNLNEHVTSSKYAYAGIETVEGHLTEGVNEAGLSLAALWFTEGEYQAKDEDETKNLANIEVMEWALGQYSTAQEVLDHLEEMKVFGEPIPALNGLTPVHFSLTDRGGANFVIEYIDGEMTVYDNRENRVLTNEPRIEQQLAELEALYEKHPELNSEETAVEFNSLPGGYGAKSRFQKMSVLKRYLPEATDAATAVNQSISLLNNIDYPRGVPGYEAAAEGDRGQDKQETAWISIIDLTDMKYYYRTSTNYTVKYVDLNEVGFENEVRFNLYDISDQFKKVDVSAQ